MIAGVVAGLTGAGVGFGVEVVAGGVAVFVFVAGVFGLGVGFGVVTGTGHKTKPLGVTEQPAGKSCMNGL